MPDLRHGRRLLLAGLVDSFGLSLGWTTFTLIAVERYGLSAAALYNASMLTGIVISAPVTMWLSRYLAGGPLLRLVGIIELPLRLGTLAALLMGAAPASIALAIVVMNVAAWTGYAGMRAEVADCDPGARSMVRYAVAIASIEAVAASVAALLPVTGHSTASRVALAAIFILYGASLTPQFWCANHARVLSGRQIAAQAASAPTATRRLEPTTRADRAGRVRGRPSRSKIVLMLAAGTSIMLIASGPATLNTALAADFYGHLSVIAASIVFSLGCVLATPITNYVSTLQVRARSIWTIWSIGMLLGWLVAPWSLAGMLFAQLLSGLSLTAFHGEMDSAVSKIARPAQLTSLLALAGALRAVGSAVSVRLLPVFLASFNLAAYSAALIALLVFAAATVAVIDRLSGHGQHAVGVRVAGVGFMASDGASSAAASSL